jgi:uncharacterized protein
MFLVFANEVYMTIFPDKIRFVLSDKSDGHPGKSIAMMLQLYATRKNDYHMVLPNTDDDGILEIDSEYLKEQIRIESNTAQMDYASGLENCKAQFRISIMSYEGVKSTFQAGQWYDHRIDFPEKYRMLMLAENHMYIPVNYMIDVEESRRLQTVPLIIEQRKPRRFRNFDKLSPDRDLLFISVAFRDIDAFKKSFDRKAINRKSRFEIGLLHTAIMSRKHDIALFLIENGINVGMRDYHGNTALHYLCEFRDLGLAMALLEKGADVNARNKNGCSIIWKAVSRASSIKYGNDYEMVKLIMKYSPDTRAKSRSGLAPFDLARIEKDETLMKILNGEKVD